MRYDICSSYSIASNVLLALKCRSFEEPASSIEGTMQPGTTSLRYIQAQYTDVPCPIEVRITMPAACRMCTGKAFASALPKMQADVAHLRRVCWGNEMDHETGIVGLIGDEGSQLGEGPTVAPSPLGLLPKFLVGALPDAGQVFQGDRASRVQGSANQFLTDLVVRLALKARFTPRQPCQKLPASAPRTSGAFRGFLLEGRTLAARAITQGGQRLSAPVLIIARVGNIGASQVHAKDISSLWGIGAGLLSCTCRQTVPSRRLTSVALVGVRPLSHPFW